MSVSGCSSPSTGQRPRACTSSRTGRSRSVFTTRAPCRPGGIGMSLVPLLRRDGNILHVSHVDMLDGTPLLDIKPHSPDLDSGALL